MTTTTLNKQLVATLLLLLFSTALFEVTNIDIAVQDHLYNFGVHHWLIDRHEPVLRLLLYDGIKVVYLSIFLFLFIARLLCNRVEFLREYKHGLTVVCISILLVPFVVACLKELTNMPCPKDLRHYDSIYPHISLFSAYPKSFYPPGDIACYPAGHASGGFGFMSLFFLFKKPRNRRVALAVALSAGWITGGYKMVIGDHFLSHTVLSMLLAWLIILLVRMKTYPNDTLKQYEVVRGISETA